MRVGVNCFLLESHIGGLKQYFINLFDWLFEYDSENEYTLFYFPRNIGELAKLRSDRWKRRAILLDKQSQIAPHLKNIDLYFCPFSALWPRPVPLPSVVTLVDIQEVFYPQFFSSVELHSRRHHYPSSTRAADCVLTISQFSKSTLVENHLIPPAKVVVAHLCADPLYFRADEIQSPLQIPIPFADFVFFPANRWYHKNHDVLLRALSILRDRGQQANAVFTGFDVDGGYPVMRKAAEYHVQENVHSAGYVTVPQMAYLYRHAEMLVFPSLFEGFGMPPIEAMAAGCPAVVANSTCLPEICGNAAEYFDANDPAGLADAICRVRAERGRRQELVQQGYAQAALFSAERMGRAHLDAFARAVGTYSTAHFLWHKLIYQPWHWIRVQFEDAVGQRRVARRNAHRCSITFSAGWYSRESDGPNWFRWTNGRGKVEIHTTTPMQLRLTGEIASLELPNEVRVFINGALLKSWTLDGDFKFGTIPYLVAELKAGKNTIEFVSGRRGVRGAPDDPRTLAVAVRNLAFSDPDGAVECLSSN